MMDLPGGNAKWIEALAWRVPTTNVRKSLTAALTEDDRYSWQAQFRRMICGIRNSLPVRFVD
jgi:hypothetical protein